MRRVHMCKVFRQCGRERPCAHQSTRGRVIGPNRLERWPQIRALVAKQREEKTTPFSSSDGMARAAPSAYFIARYFVTTTSGRGRVPGGTRRQARAVVRESLSVLRRRFAGERTIEGFHKDGPVAVARFEKGEGGEPDLRDARALRQREVSARVERLLASIELG